MEKPTTIGRAQSRDKSSGSPENFSPEMFEEDNPRDPSELKQIDILEKVTKNFYDHTKKLFDGGELGRAESKNPHNYRGRPNFTSVSSWADEDERINTS